MLGAEVNLDVNLSADDVMQKHRERLEKAAQLGFSVSQEEVPVDTGTLKQSGFPPEWRGEQLVFGYAAGNALPMEDGTEPGHRPPIAPLQRWAERIGKDPGFGVWVATEKIPQEGVDPQPYLAPARQRMEAWVGNRGLDL